MLYGSLINHDILGALSPCLFRLLCPCIETFIISSSTDMLRLGLELLIYPAASAFFFPEKQQQNCLATDASYFIL